MSAVDPRCERLSELTQCAYRLGLAFGAEAERAESHDRRMEFFDLFDRCFFAVRVATALELRLVRGSRASEAESERDAVERDPLEQDPPEQDRPERYDERDRERDVEREPASLPVLLRTLQGVAAEAATLPGPPPAALPTLRELLAHVASEPAPSAASPARALRARLTGSATTQALTLPKPRLRDNPPARRATGPPRR